MKETPTPRPGGLATSDTRRLVSSPPWTEGGRPAPADAVLDPDEARRALRDFHRLRREMMRSTRHSFVHRLVQAYFVSGELKYPFRLLKALWSTAPVVRREYGISLRTQLWQMLRLRRRHRVSPKEFYENHMFLPARREEAEVEIKPWDNVEIFGGFHGWENPPFDKIDFHDRAVRAGLPVAPILAVCPPGRSPRRRDPSSSLWEGDLFSKLATGGRGTSQRRWRRTPDGGLADDDDVTAESVDALLRLLCAEPRRGRHRHSPVIVQPCLRNHEDVLSVTRGGLSTARICTVQRSGGRAPEVFYVQMKLVVGDAHVDNMSDGRNLVGAVDIATGRVVSAYGIGEGGLLVPAERHPDSGRPVDELVLPFWDETLALCIEGQTVFDETPSLGWDVAMTPDGPVLIEANIMFGCATLNGWPLGLTPYPRWTTEWLEEALGRRSAGPN